MGNLGNKKKVMLSAVQTTKRLTLGNYLGAIRNWVKEQDQHDCLFFAVDLHSITVRQDPALLREQTYFAIAAYLAAGIDPKHCTLFVQSHVSEHAELAWVLNCFSYMGELNRMTQFKDKSGKAGQNIAVGLFTYPILMAADILLYDTDLVPVGHDQKQHIEVTRDWAMRMNNAYPATSGEDLFRIPVPQIAKVGARIMDLQTPTQKMSKSAVDENGTLFLDDSNDVIVKKIKRATTDSGAEIRFDDQAKPGVSNLLAIQAVLTGKSIAELEEHFTGKQYGHLKMETADLVVATMGPMRDKIHALMADRGELDRILRVGAEKARPRAHKTLKRVYDRIGFLGR